MGRDQNKVIEKSVPLQGKVKVVFVNKNNRTLSRKWLDQGIPVTK